MIKNVIFDIGNVLVGFDWPQYLHSFGFSPEKEQAIANALFLGPLWKELDRGVIPLDELREMFCRLSPRYRDDIAAVFDHCEKCITRRSSTIPWLQSLKGRGLRIYYLSNYSEFMFERTQEALDFLPLMDGGLLSYRVRQIKPDSEIFRTLIEHCPEIIPEESVFFDDTAENTEAAARLGFHGIVFHDRKQAEADLAGLLASDG